MDGHLDEQRGGGGEGGDCLGYLLEKLFHLPRFNLRWVGVRGVSERESERDKRLRALGAPRPPIHQAIWGGGDRLAPPREGLHLPRFNLRTSGGSGLSFHTGVPCG